MGTDNRLSTLPLIARGGQADIYDYGNGKVIRVPRRPQDYDRIRYEYRVYSSLAGTNIAAPRVHELIEVNDAPAIIMDKIDGVSMMDQIKTQPFSIRAKAVKLADMHLGVLKVNAAASITAGTQQAKYCINASNGLSEHVKSVVLGVLDQLPPGNFLCHGDFHPGNILQHDGRDFIIDWSGASRNDIAADIAHTYILLKVVPRVPGTGLIMHATQKLLGSFMANVYLKKVMKSVSLAPAVLSRWVLIKAAERTYYGLPSEKRRLQTFIAKYVRALSSGMNEDHLYRTI